MSVASGCATASYCDKLLEIKLAFVCTHARKKTRNTAQKTFTRCHFGVCGWVSFIYICAVNSRQQHMGQIIHVVVYVCACPRVRKTCNVRATQLQLFRCRRRLVYVNSRSTRATASKRHHLHALCAWNATITIEVFLFSNVFAVIKPAPFELNVLESPCVHETLPDSGYKVSQQRTNKKEMRTISLCRTLNASPPQVVLHPAQKCDKVSRA